MKSSALETWVGAIVLIVAGAFLAFAYSRSEGGPGDGAYTLVAKFGRIDGITVGSDVRLAGVKIGAVASQKLDPATYLAAVELSITSELEIPDDSVAKVAVDSLLGGAHIAIEPGGSEMMLAAGDEFFFTQGSVDLLGLAFRAVGGGLGGEEDAEAGGLDALPAPGGFE